MELSNALIRSSLIVPQTKRECTVGIPLVVFFLCLASWKIINNERQRAKPHGVVVLELAFSEAQPSAVKQYAGLSHQSRMALILRM